MLADGELTALRVKQETIEGELLSYDDETIEIKGYGKLCHTGKLPVYQTYGEVSEKSISDVTLGNMNVEYVTGGEAGLRHFNPRAGCHPRNPCAAPGG